MITQEMRRAGDDYLRSIAGDVPDRETAEMALETYWSDNFREHIGSLRELREASEEIASRYF